MNWRYIRHEAAQPAAARKHANSLAADGDVEAALEYYAAPMHAFLSCARKTGRSRSSAG